MAQLSDDCFAFGGDLMRIDDALALLADRVTPVAETEEVSLRLAAGRVLAEDIVAERDVPPHENSAVDGYAVAHADLLPDGDTRLPVTGRAAAGHPLGRAAQKDEAVRIFTGAPMPDGMDTVFMQEDCREETGADGQTMVVLPAGLTAGANRRRRGEDVTAGSIILHAGARLRPQDIGLAASVGRDVLVVFAPISAAVFSTGDEVYEPGTTPPTGGVFDANRHTLMALLEGLGCRVTDLGILPDDRIAITEALAAATRKHAVVVTSGGMSTGEEDHVKAAVEAAGSLHFWRLAIKPGRPLALGQIAGVPFVGLPGNPVAMMVTFLRIARPVILRLMGAVDTAPHSFRVFAGFEHKKKKDRREWVRARLATGSDGRLTANKFPRDGAGILTSMVEADGLVELPEDMTRLTTGTEVDFLPFSELV